jgi:acetyl-CoA C-acetyltransferase
MTDVAIVGVGTTPYGRHKDKSATDLAQMAVKEALEDARDLTIKDIEGFVLSSQNPEILQKQGNSVNHFSEFLGISAKFATRVEGACVSGSMGLRTAYMSVKSGAVDVCMVVGVEKCYELSGPDIMAAFSYVIDRDWEAAFGSNAPMGFALFATRHMHEYGTTEEQLAMVAVKNRRFASKNPKAHFQKPITLEDVLNSRPVCKPLKLLDCCPVSDGASAAILVRADLARKFSDTPVYIRGMGQHLIAENVISSLSDLTEFTALKRAAKEAYRDAKVEPKDIDVAETHDCFTIAEILEIEALGFCKKGEGGRFVEEGQTDIGGKIPVNTGGGLLSRGHPIGATGICQAGIIVQQLRGEAPEGRQVNAEIALSQNLGGWGTSQAVVVYSR